MWASDSEKPHFLGAAGGLSAEPASVVKAARWMFESPAWTQVACQPATKKTALCESTAVSASRTICLKLLGARRA